MPAPVLRDKVEKWVLFFTIVLSVSAWVISYRLHYVLTYNDAASHLNIARRVVDNLTPGLAQIGTVWLPLPHVLMLTLAWNDFFWHTAMAGSIVSMVSFVICVLFTYKLIFFLSKNPLAAWLGTMVMALNPNFLYLQTTPMTEPLLLATFAFSSYYLARYIEDNKLGHLILTGVGVMAASLTRYDGWFLFVVLLILLPVWGYLTQGRKKAERVLLLFLFVGGFGIFLWLIWNLAIFGNPLYFLLGPYSAFAQQRVLKTVGQLPTEGNLPLAIVYYFWSIVDNNGFFTLIFALAGLMFVILKLKNKQQLVTIVAVLSPLVFNILALYFGQSAMNVPQAEKDAGLFNIRYGLLVLPSLALIIGLIGAYSRKYLLLVIVLLIQTVIFYQQGVPVVLADGINGLKNTYYTVEASAWLSQNYDGGLILTSLASHDAFVARAGLPMKNYIHEGTRYYWTNALKDPGRYVRYIAVLEFPPDSVYRAIYKNSSFTKNFTAIHSYEQFTIYQHK